jgi:hypothetical protein
MPRRTLSISPAMLAAYRRTLWERGEISITYEEEQRPKKYRFWLEKSSSSGDIRLRIVSTNGYSVSTIIRFVQSGNYFRRAVGVDREIPLNMDSYARRIEVDV